MNALLELRPDIGRILLRDAASRHDGGGKQPEKKSHDSHAAIIKDYFAMATLIPPQELLGLYAAGWFPMAMPDGSLQCFSPDPRGIIPLEKFHVPHGLKKTLRDPAWETRLDTAFEEVIRACAERPETWISEDLIQSYLALHRAGHAHSLEIWREGRLAGGLYGVQLGAAFFGESMFHRVTGASKVALARLAALLREGGFQLLDTQWLTPHLGQFGAMEIPRRDYLARLSASVQRHAVLRL